jgi:high-affinity Fe2+/Pb2+ permease
MDTRLRTTLAVLIAICGGLAVLYLFFMLIGTVSLGRAQVATVVALALAAVWLLGVWYRSRTGATRIQRYDRERRGF